MARILIADDDATLRALMQRTLSGDGHAVVAVEDGLDALNALATDTFEVLVSDLNMPGLDGIGLAAKVTSQVSGAQAAMKVLLISGLAEELQRARGFPANRVTTLQKPFTLEQLRDKVRGLLDG